MSSDSEIDLPSIASSEGQVDAGQLDATSEEEDIQPPRQLRRVLPIRRSFKGRRFAPVIDIDSDENGNYDDTRRVKIRRFRQSADIAWGCDCNILPLPLHIVNGSQTITDDNYENLLRPGTIILVFEQAYGKWRLGRLIELTATHNNPRYKLLMQRDVEHDPSLTPFHYAYVGKNRRHVGSHANGQEDDASSNQHTRVIRCENKWTHLRYIKAPM